MILLQKCFSSIKKYAKLQRFVALIAYMKKTLKYVLLLLCFVMLCLCALLTKPFYTSQYLYYIKI